ncbi:hypothetical protein DER44DRAFT_432069 [Fusarium oxysporum]|nr:hypothetical protein DER44DRAFT_432069 [Fusarium oxysporum]
MLMGRRAKNLPPRPSTLPIIGNIHQIPITGLHAKFLQWGEQYGGIFSLKIASSTMTVLSDRKAVHDLVDKKGAIYSGLQPNDVANIVTHGDSFAFMNKYSLISRAEKVIEFCWPRNHYPMFLQKRKKTQIPSACQPLASSEVVPSDQSSVCL